MPAISNLQFAAQFQEIDLKSIQKHEQDIYYLDNFLKFLIQKENPVIDNKTSPVLVHPFEDEEFSAEKLLPAALIQVIILFAVFLTVYLIFKCNKIMKTCRDNILPNSLPFYLGEANSDDLKNERINCRDLLCYSCYKIKAKKRFKNRRLRNQRFNRERIERKQTNQITRTSSLYRRKK